MRYTVYIPNGSGYYSFPLLSSSDYQRIRVPGVVIFDLYKVHNHRYDLKAFFYRSEVIVSTRSFRTKKELYGAIQILLQEFL